MFRALCLLLHGWCNYTGTRKLKKGESADCLKSIAFDKFVVAVGRWWDQLFRKFNRGFDGETTNAARAVTFPFPLVERPGKHGHGRALDNGRETKFVTKLLFDLQGEGILPYFQITTPHDQPGAASDASRSPTDPDTTIKPAFLITDRREFLEGFTDREAEVLSEIERVLRRLSPSEIRILGTHETVAKTLEAINWEFKAILRHGLCDRIETAIRNGCDCVASASELMEFADEACRKGGENKGTYVEARALALSEIVDPDLKDAFRKTQDEPEVIWDNSQVKRRFALARRIKADAAYIIALCTVVRAQAPFASKTIDRGLAEASSAALQQGASGFPGRVEDVIEQVGNLRPCIVDAVCRELEYVREALRKLICDAR